MSRKKTTNRLYMRKYYSSPIKRAEKRKRDNDRNSYVRKNGKIPKWKELHHTGNRAKWPTRVVSRYTNRKLWAKRTVRLRKKVN